MRVKDPADPRRCKYSYPHEQCWNQAEYGSEYCSAHGGRSTEEAEKKRMYHLAEVENRRRLAELSGHEDIKSLREEIGLLRMLIEKRFNMIRTDDDYKSSAASLNSMFLTLDRLVKSCHALEQSLGDLLSRQSVARLAQEMCQIVMEELEGIEGYEAIIDRIVDRLFPTVETAQNLEPLKLPAS